MIIGSDTLYLLFGVLIPAWGSLTTLRREEGANERKRWLMYWMVFACVWVVESVVDFKLRIYRLARMVFFVWLVLPPKCYNASVVYEKGVRRLMKVKN